VKLKQDKIIKYILTYYITWLYAKYGTKSVSNGEVIETVIETNGVI